MKRLALLLLLALGLGRSVPARADVPYSTWAWAPGGYLTQTQAAYEPVAEIDLPTEGPQDLVATVSGDLYVADTGNGRILRLRGFEVVASYGEGVLEGPTGLHVGADGTLYVADGAANVVVILSPDGQPRASFGRPDEPLFGANRQFLPRKIAVDARQNLYLISEGSVDGVVQMNLNGDFIGYFGANTATMTLGMILQRTFLTEAQLAQFVRNEAASPSNLTIDSQSLLSTVTAGAPRTESIRRFTVAGRNILELDYGSRTFRDLDVSADGLLTAVDSGGVIYQYDRNGALLFVFGALDTGEQRLGMLRNPAAIASASDTLFVLDQDKNAIVVFRVTEFARTVQQGVRLYNEGYYAEARPHFERVLAFNGSFGLAYKAIADAQFKAGDYENALRNYLLAEDQEGYSEAFWELRNVVLQRTLATALGGLAGLWLLAQVGAVLDRRLAWSQPLTDWLRGLRRFRLIDDLVFLFRFIRHPLDSFTYIKTGERGSLPFAILLYAWVVLAYVLSLYLTGYSLNRFSNPLLISLELEVTVVIGLVALWNAANYLVSTINDGEGRLRDVIIGSAYSLFPVALFILPIALISNVLTQNEVFLHAFSQQLMWAWTGLMLFLMVQEIHNYAFSETVRNVLMTLFTMAMVVLTGYILYVLFNQVFDFVFAILQEVGLRA
jgi:tetratricopeptide (TPR) repeat protein